MAHLLNAQRHTPATTESGNVIFSVEFAGDPWSSVVSGTALSGSQVYR